MVLKKLAQLRDELPAMEKTAKGYNYMYFDINQMIEALKPLLDKHGLTIFQPLSHINDRPALKTIIMDKDTGEQYEEITPLLQLSEPQKQGGVITYFRRYALQSMLFMEAIDNDASDKDLPF